MRPETRHIALLLAMLGLSGPAAADDDRYRVEIIVFENWGKIDPLYRWPGEPNTSGAIDLVPFIDPDPPAPVFIFGDSASRSAADNFRRRGQLEDRAPTPRGRPSVGGLAQPNVSDSTDQATGGASSSGVVPEFEPNVGPDSEAAPGSNDTTDPSSRVTLVPAQGNPHSPDQPTPLGPLEELFQLLEPEQYVLANAWDRISRSPDYRPLIHMSWIQPAAPFGEPHRVRIHGGPIVYRHDRNPGYLLLPAADGPPVVETVDGVIALERGRYLHLRLDLALHQKEDLRRAHPADFKTQQQPGNYLTHRLVERRQITDNVINYFDHQHFGVIASVVRVEPSDADTDTP